MSTAVYITKHHKADIKRVTDVCAWSLAVLLLYHICFWP